MELVARARAGDRSAFGELVARHRPMVMRLAVRLTNDQALAADCTQATFLRAWERISQLRENGRFLAWLMAICRSVAANMRRAETVRVAHESVRVDMAAPVFDVERWIERATVRDAVSELADLYREPVTRFYFDGFSQREIADELGVPLGTLKARLHYARLKLKEVLSEEEEPDMARFTNVMEAFMKEAEPEPKLTYEELACETLRHYDLGELQRVGSVYQPSDSIGIAIETDRGQYRLWRYQPWMTRDLVELQHHMLRHLHERGLSVKRLVSTADGETVLPIDSHLVAVFEWFSGSGIGDGLRRRDTLEAVGRLHGSWVAAIGDFDPPAAGWRELASCWRPRKGWALALPFHDLPDVPERMGLFRAAREMRDAPPYHDDFLRGIDETERWLGRFAERVETLEMKELPHGLNHGVLLFGLQGFDLMITDADDFVYEPRIGDLGRLLWVVLHKVPGPRQQAYGRARAVMDAFRQHVELSEGELRALPWAALSFELFYRVFHVLLYLAEAKGGPDAARYLLEGEEESSDSLTAHEEQLEKLTEELLAG